MHKINRKESGGKARRVTQTPPRTLRNTPISLRFKKYADMFREDLNAKTRRRKGCGFKKETLMTLIGRIRTDKNSRYLS